MTATRARAWHPQSGNVNGEMQRLDSFSSVLGKLAIYAQTTMYAPRRPRVRAGNIGISFHASTTAICTRKNLFNFFRQHPRLPPGRRNSSWTAGVSASSSVDFFRFRNLGTAARSFLPALLRQPSRRPRILRSVCHDQESFVGGDRPGRHHAGAVRPRRGQLRLDDVPPA